MEKYFTHISKNVSNDPLRFFRELGNENILNQAINNFMPIENVFDDEFGREITYFQPQGNYRNINYLDYYFEVEVEDLDYRPEQPEDPDSITYWVKYNFTDVLNLELNRQCSISKQLLIEYINCSKKSIQESILLILNDLYRQKVILNSTSLYLKFPQILETINKLNNFINVEYNLLLSGPHGDIPNNVLKLQNSDVISQKTPEEVINKNSDANFHALYSILKEADKKFSIDEQEFVDVLNEIYKGDCITKKYYLYFKNAKIFYLLLSILNKNCNIDFSKLEKSRTIYINDKVFEKKYMGVYPYDKEFNIRYSEIIKELNLLFS